MENSLLYLQIELRTAYYNYPTRPPFELIRDVTAYPQQSQKMFILKTLSVNHESEFGQLVNIYIPITFDRNLRMHARYL